MQKIIPFTPLLLCTLSYGTTSLQLTHETFHFENSQKKDKGVREGVDVAFQSQQNHYQFYYEQTHTQTFQPPLSEDLKVKKYYAKYSRELDGNQALFLSYATIDDNLMKETDGGKIYGFGYRYNTLKLSQYLSDYPHFNVYQSEASYTFKKVYPLLNTNLTLVEKYIHLQNKESNPFSQNAKTNYFTTGIKLHTHYQSYHFGAGAFLGRRIFAVMNNGLKVQHHAMEFNKTYRCGIGKSFQWGEISVTYIYQEATEIATNTQGVTVKNLVVQMKYHF